MKKISHSKPLATADDTPAMTEAVEALKSWGCKVARPTVFQLKIGDVSYYPDTETIVVDGKKGEKARGLDALRIALKIRDFRTAAYHLRPK